MPFVNVRTARGLLSADQKQRLHQELTEVLIRIEGGGDPDFRKYVTVLIEEHPASSWSVSGRQLDDAAVQALAENAKRASSNHPDPVDVECQTGASAP